MEGRRDTWMQWRIITIAIGLHAHTCCSTRSAADKSSFARCSTTPRYTMIFASVHPPSAPMSCDHSAPRYRRDVAEIWPRSTGGAPSRARAALRAKSRRISRRISRRPRACSRRMLVPSRPHKLSIVDDNCVIVDDSCFRPSSCDAVFVSYSVARSYSWTLAEIFAEIPRDSRYDKTRVFI